MNRRLTRRSLSHRLIGISQWLEHRPQRRLLLHLSGTPFGLAAAVYNLNQPAEEATRATSAMNWGSRYGTTTTTGPGSRPSTSSDTGFEAHVEASATEMLRRWQAARERRPFLRGLSERQYRMGQNHRLTPATPCGVVCASSCSVVRRTTALFGILEG